MPAETPKQDPALAMLHEKVLRVQQILLMPEGQELLAILDMQYLTNLRGKTDIDMTFNAGRADVVGWLHFCKQYNPEGR